MNKIVICLLVFVFWNHSNGIRISGSDFDENLIDSDDYSEQQQHEVELKTTALKDKLVENCFLSILGRTLSCIMQTMEKWNVDPYGLKTNINDRSTCCAIWQMTDCLKNNAKMFCTAEEESEFKIHMNQLTEKRNAKNCTLYTYSSNSCGDQQSDSEAESESDDNPVEFKQVLFRENNHILNTDQIKEQITPNSFKGLGQLFPKDANSGPMSTDELSLAQRLLDRVNRITINQMVIDLHPIKRTDISKPKKTEENEESFEP